MLVFNLDDSTGMSIGLFELLDQTLIVTIFFGQFDGLDLVEIHSNQFRHISELVFDVHTDSLGFITI